MSVCVRCPEALWLRWDWRRRFRNHALPGAQTPRGRGLVWSLPALSGGRGGEGVDAGLQVQLPEPDRTSLQCSLPWRKQIRNEGSSCLSRGRQKCSLMEQLAHRRNMNGKSSLIKPVGALECDSFSYTYSSLSIAFLLPADFTFICAVIQTSFLKIFNHYNSK